MSEPKAELQMITADKLTQLTGLTDRRHRQLAKDGWFPMPNRALYQLTATIAGMFRYYREQRTAADKLKEEKIRLTKADADLRELQAAAKRGTLIDAEEVQKVIASALMPCRQQFLSLPATLAARCNPADPPLAEAALRQWSEVAMRTVQEKIA